MPSPKSNKERGGDESREVVSKYKKTSMAMPGDGARTKCFIFSLLLFLCSAKGWTMHCTELCVRQDSHNSAKHSSQMMLAFLFQYKSVFEAATDERRAHNTSI